MEIHAKDIINLLDRLAPPCLAEKWDNPGLQVGNPNWPVHRILVSLDVTPENVSYAVQNGINMIVSHHPMLFHGIQEINGATNKGALIEALIRNKITSFAAHTNLDSVSGGINDALADKLQLIHCMGLVPVFEETYSKFTVYMTNADARGLLKKLRETHQLDMSNVYILEDDDDSTNKVRIEFTVNERSIEAVEKEIKSIGENTAYDLYRLANRGRQECMGRVGYLPSEMTGEEALRYIKNKLEIPVLRYAGNANKSSIKKVAVLGGAGAEFLHLAKSNGADLYLTGDLKYHEAQGAIDEDILFVDGGHFYTERIIIPYLMKRLQAEFKARGWDIQVYEDKGAKDIFSYI